MNRLQIIKQFFYIFSKKFVKIKMFVFCILMLPISVFILSSIFNSSQDLESNINIGVVFEDLENLEDMFISNININFYNNYDLLYESIIKNNIAVGYVFKDGFYNELEQIEVGDISSLESLVQVIKLENEYIDGYINNIVLSGVYQEIIPYVSNARLLDNEVDLGIVNIKNQIDYYNNSKNNFKLEYIIIENNNIIESNNLSNNNIIIIKGTIGIFLLALSLIGAIYISDLNKAIVLFKPYLGEIELKIYALLPIYVYGTIAGVISIFILSNNMGSVSSIGSMSDNIISLEIIKLLLLQAVYMLLIIVLVMLLNKILVLANSSLNPENIIILLMPFIILFNLIIHPIFIDITKFISEIEYILKLSPLWYYLS